MQKNWTNDEIKILTENYSKCYSDEMILLLPNRTPEAIRKHAKRLGLKRLVARKQRPSSNILNHWTSSELEIINENYGKISNKDILQMLPGRCEDSLRHLASRLGLRAYKPFIDECFESKVDKNSGIFGEDANHPTQCWVWIGTYDKRHNGYGNFGTKDFNIGAHKFAYLRYHGKINDNNEIDHLCRIKRCVNPEHLEQVSASENMRRALPHRRPIFRGNKICILGDTHGKFDDTNTAIKDALKHHRDIGHSMIVGDHGDMFPKKYGFSRFIPDVKMNHMWIRGNHDRQDLLIKYGNTLNPNIRYMPDGSLFTINGINYLCIGGASSPDAHLRTPQLDWWPEEVISQNALNKALSHDEKVDVIFSHERPSIFGYPEEWPKWDKDFGKSDRIALSIIWEKYRPKFWFGGHYHFGHDMQFEQTRVITCPVMDKNHYWTVFDGTQIWRNWK